MYKNFIKPLSDIGMGIFLSVITLPIILAMLILVKLETPGSPLFRQIRVGRGLRPFTIFKIRTMTQNASALGSHSTAKNDSRITKIGKILRKTSLDELPQFWNLALGQMSLVGPRPDLPVQEYNYKEKQWQQRHQVRPGITGLAQALLRSQATPLQRTRLDLFYVSHCCFSLDLRIIFATMRILTKKGTQN